MTLTPGPTPEGGVGGGGGAITICLGAAAREGGGRDLVDGVAGCVTWAGRAAKAAPLYLVPAYKIAMYDGVGIKPLSAKPESVQCLP